MSLLSIPPSKTCKALQGYNMVRPLSAAGCNDTENEKGRKWLQHHEPPWHFGHFVPTHSVEQYQWHLSILELEATMLIFSWHIGLGQNWGNQFNQSMLIVNIILYYIVTPKNWSFWVSNHPFFGGAYYDRQVDRAKLSTRHDIDLGSEECLDSEPWHGSLRDSMSVKDEACTAQGRKMGKRCIMLHSYW